MCWGGNKASPFLSPMRPYGEMVIILPCHGSVSGSNPDRVVINIHMKEHEVQALIDKAIDRHNKTATLISASIGSVLLFFYAHGVLMVAGYWK